MATAGGFLSTIKKESRPYIESLRDDIAARRNPDFFWPTGTQVYCGRQGSGKTVSAVYHVLKLKQRYSKMILVSNLQLNHYQAMRLTTATIKNPALMRQFLDHARDPKNYVFFDDMDSLATVLTSINNGFYGVTYLIDEIHTYFNALDSKNIPPYVFTEISQQRKQRKLIIGTSQLFLRMAKPLREQCDNLIICRTLGGILTVQTAYDGMSITQDYDGSLHGDRKRMGWFFHNRKIRESFDTYQKIVSGTPQFEEIAQPLYEKRGIFGKKKQVIGLKQ